MIKSETQYSNKVNHLLKKLNSM